MKWVTAGITFVNLSVVCGLLLGLAGRGLNTVSAALALVCGAAFAIAAFLGTRDSAVRQKSANGPTAEQKPRKSSGSEETQNSLPSALMRYRRVWFWAVAVCFAIFAVRSFCWLLYIDSSELKIQSPNNLGDLSLHLTLIKNFANGVALWPDNPIFVFSKLRYPAGIDLFNATAFAGSHRSASRVGLGRIARFTRDLLRVLPVGRHVRCCRIFVQRRYRRISVFEDVQVFGLSGHSSRYRA